MTIKHPEDPNALDVPHADPEGGTTAVPPIPPSHFVPPPTPPAPLMPPPKGDPKAAPDEDEARRLASEPGALTATPGRPETEADHTSSQTAERKSHEKAAEQRTAEQKTNEQKTNEPKK